MGWTGDVACLGEAMMRLSVQPGDRLAGAQGFDANVAGAELNVAANLAAIGRSTGWVGALPDNLLGDWVVRRVRAMRVDDRGIVRVPRSRLGTFFVEMGVAPRATQVVYDRGDSAASHFAPAAVPWSYLGGAQIVHLSGITAAIGGASRATMERALAWARERRRPLSFDVNYRSLLWDPHQAADWMVAHVRGVEVLTCAERDARSLFGMAGDAPTLARALQAKFEANWVVVTRGARGAVAVTPTGTFEQRAIETEVIDRIGAGDAFVAGMLDGWLERDVEAGLARGVALASLALGERGDQVTTNRAEMERVMNSATSVGGIVR